MSGEDPEDDPPSLDTGGLHDSADTGDSDDTTNRLDTADTSDTADTGETHNPNGCSVLFLLDDGTEQDLTDSLLTGDFIELTEPGTVVFCPGTWEAHLDLQADVSIVGSEDPAETVLSGGDQGSVVLFSAAHLAVSVEGVTIDRGRARGAEDVAIGGGIRCQRQGTLTIKNTRFTQNTGEDAGAISGSDGCAIEIEDSWFEANTAVDDGGAIQVSYSDLTMARVTFTGNTAADGGAVYSIASRLEMEDVLFDGNSAELDDEGGGALLLFSYSAATIRRTTFQGNSCGRGGAALFAASEVILEESVFTGNSGTNGGGIYLYGGVDLTATDCDFSSNKPDDLSYQTGYGKYESYTWGEDASFTCQSTCETTEEKKKP